MEIVLAALVAAGVAVAVVMLVQRPRTVGAGAPVAEARLAMEGAWPRGWARATGPEPVALWWEVGSGHILTVGVRGTAHHADPLLFRIVRGRDGTEAD